MKLRPLKLQQAARASQKDAEKGDARILYVYCLLLDPATGTNNTEMNVRWDNKALDATMGQVQEVYVSTSLQDNVLGKKRGDRNSKDDERGVREFTPRGW